MYTKGIWGQVSIDTLNLYPWSISWSINYYNLLLVEILSILDQQSFNSRPSVDRLTLINLNIVNSWPMSTKMLMECRSGIHVESMEGFDQGCFIDFIYFNMFCKFCETIFVFQDKFYFLWCTVYSSWDYFMESHSILIIISVIVVIVIAFDNCYCYCWSTSTVDTFSARSVSLRLSEVGTKVGPDQLGPPVQIRSAYINSDGIMQGT